MAEAHARTSAPPDLYDVPPGTKPSKCNGPTCGKTVYWIRTRQGRPMPIDVEVEGGRPPGPMVDPKQKDLFGDQRSKKERTGKGVPHFATCSDREYFRAGGGRS